MSFLKVNSWKGVLVHVVIILALSALLFYSIFYIWLPSYTKFGETKDVPVLEKLSISEAEDVLKANDLRLVIQDTAYNSRFEPGVITRQEPKGNTKVKENRRVYVSVNTEKVPLANITNKDIKGWVNGNYESIASKISSKQLKVNKISKCGKYKDYVIAVLYKGDTLSTSSKVRIGGTIDVVTWNGRCH